MKIYHNPRCSKSRQTLAIIQAAGIEPEIIEYLTNPPTAQELREIINALNIEPHQLFRTKETLYRELGLQEKTLSPDEAIEILAAHPKLIERPIVIDSNRAVIGRPPENVNELL